MFKSVVSKLMAFTLAISLFISVTIVSTITYKQNELFEQELIQKAEILSSLLTQVLINPIYDLKINQVTDFLIVIKSDADVVNAWAMDNEGLIISDGTEDNEYQDEEILNLRSIIKNIAQTHLYEITHSDNFSYITSPVLTFNQDLIGYVHLEISRAETKQHLHDSLVIMISLSALLFVLGMLIAFVSARKLVAPLSAIRNATHLIAKGDFSTILPVHGEDELAQLSTDINRMSSNLESSTVSKNYLKNIIDSTANSLFVADSHENLVTVNQTLLDTLGYDDIQLLGRKVSQLFEHGKGQNLKNLKSAENISFITKSGEVIPVSLSLSTLVMPGQGKDWSVGVVQDIREKLEADRLLNQAVIDAETATLAKSQFLSTMSHEIRTPMNGVIGMAQLLEDSPLNDEQSDYLRTIIRSGNSLLSIINDILDFSKLDAEMTEMESIAFDLERVCQESLELISGNAKNKELEIIFDYHPDCAKNFIGDPSRIRQVLLNLLSNAVKFTKKGFIRLGISCEHLATGKEQMCMEVQDTGIGLKPEAIDHLFDVFTQADSSTTRKYGGTGLGLAISKSIVRLMGGHIGVNSVYGEGCTFYIKGVFPKAPPPPLLALKPLQGVRILFVDANKENRRIFKRMLEHMGAITTIESDPLKTLGLLHQAKQENNPFKIAILDHIMPSKTGLELGTEIRREASFDQLKLLMFSPVGEKGDSSTFTRAGFNAYLSKLCRYDILHAILSTMLEHTTGNAIITQYSIEDSRKLSTDEKNSFNASVLLVEDVLPNQIIAKKFLTNLGVDVDIASNGQEAINAYNSKQYDLLFMDCRMPIMDGYEATKIIRELEKNKETSQRIPIIALTANASSEDKTICEDAGMDDVVTKPFLRSDLSNCLSQWLPDKLIKTE